MKKKNSKMKKVNLNNPANKVKRVAQLKIINQVIPVKLSHRKRRINLLGRNQIKSI